jgi:hypothetical protein
MQNSDDIYLATPLATSYQSGADPSAAGIEEGDSIVLRGNFDRGITRYWWWAGLLGLFFMGLCTCGLGFIFLPFYLCFASSFNNAYLDTMEIFLTKRSLQIRRGGIWCNCAARIEKTILLDRIQDVTLSQGCLEKCFNVRRLTIETAGASGPQAGPELSLAGIMDPETFRNTVLAYRHDYVDNGSRADGLGTGAKTSNGNSFNATEQTSLLRDIRDSLKRMEEGSVDMGKGK